MQGVYSKEGDILHLVLSLGTSLSAKETRTSYPSRGGQAVADQLSFNVTLAIEGSFSSAGPSNFCQFVLDWMQQS